jgi:hypothetical protein
VNKLFTPHPVTIMRARSGGSVAAPGLPPLSCSSSTGRTYAYPCCAKPTDAYAGRWINARWMDEVWFSTECSCIIRAGTDLPNGIAEVDLCCY